jgi:hypothetical protein
MKKRRWRPWKRGNPDQLDSGGEMVNESEVWTSEKFVHTTVHCFIYLQLLESSLQGGSRRGLGQLVHRTLGKFTKGSSTMNAGRPQSFAPTSSSISVQDTTNNHTSEVSAMINHSWHALCSTIPQGALPHTDLVSEPNLGQPTNSGDAKVSYCYSSMTMY